MRGSTEVTEALVEATLDGAQDEEVGSSSEAPGTWAGLFKARHAGDLADIHPDLSKAAGAILYEDSQGFHFSEIFNTPNGVEKQWKSVVSELSMEDEEAGFDEVRVTESRYSPIKVRPDPKARGWKPSAGWYIFDSQKLSVDYSKGGPFRTKREAQSALNRMSAGEASESKKLDTFTRAYLEAALFTGTDESDESGGEPLDKNYSISDFAPEAIEKAIKDTTSFQDKYAELLSQAGDDEQNGHDFWLTRNGHGTGFWDRDYDEEVSKKLTAASKGYGEQNAYVGDDGQIYLS